MVVLKLKLVKGKYEYESAAAANVTSPAEDDNYGTTVLK